MKQLVPAAHNSTDHKNQVQMVLFRAVSFFGLFMTAKKKSH